MTDYKGGSSSLRRVQALQAQQEKERETYENLLKQLKSDENPSLKPIQSKFQKIAENGSAYDTIGLNSLKEFAHKRILSESEQEIKRKEEERRLEKTREFEKKEKSNKSKLSFLSDMDNQPTEPETPSEASATAVASPSTESSEVVLTKKAKSEKNPDCEEGSSKSASNPDEDEELVIKPKKKKNLRSK